MKAKKSNWKPVNELRRKLTEKLPGDSFLEPLLEGAWRVARDKSNPIRGNLVASALREIFGHIRLCCTNPVWVSSRESSVVAGMHEQTDTTDLQDQELASL